MKSIFLSWKKSFVSKCQPRLSKERWLKLKKKLRNLEKNHQKHFLKHVTSVKGIIYSRILLKRITTRRLMYLVTAAKVHQSIEKIVLKNNSFKMIFRNICTFLPLEFDPYHKMDKEYPQEGTNQAWAQKKPTTLPPLDPSEHQE